MKKTDEKLREAKYFLRKVQEHGKAPGRHPFVFYLSAFVSSARSVQLYVLEDALKQTKKAWYDAECPKHDMFKYFKAKRDMTIHREPISVGSQLNLDIVEVPLSITDEVTVEILHRDGTREVVGTEPTNRAHTAPSDEEAITVVAAWRFTDHADEIPTLAERYITQLELFLVAAAAQGLA